MTKTFLVYCNTTITEKAEVEAETLEEAIKLAEEFPEKYDWYSVGEITNTFEGD